MNIEATSLYQQMKQRTPDLLAGPEGLVDEFERLRTILKEHGKYIVLLFPEYTPHDHTRHLEQLFALADRVLGTPLYTRLSPLELLLLAFGIYAHDWGMAVSESERQSLLTAANVESFAFLPDEPPRAQSFASNANLAGIAPEVAWREYVRLTHGLRSGARLRRHLAPLGSVFADAVARIAEGHTLPLREIRNPDRYPLALSVFGETANIAALATYVRMLDLLDVGEDRTPYVLWKFVAPVDPISNLEWRKHRALSPAAVKQGSALREVLINGQTDDCVLFAALADLRAWIDEQFAGSIAHLRVIGGQYDIDLDSRITWNVETIGFKPLSVRFELDRREVLGLLSSELYKDDTHAFLRELLQNSVDAIDMREALLSKHGLTLKGEVRVRITSGVAGLHIEWRDNGIGMDEDVLSSYFARPGRCWYRSREASQLAEIDAVSRFGIGVLSFFAVSGTLTVETRRDPQVGESRPGLAIEIPTRDSHFRIRAMANAPVGTTIHLQISPHLVRAISKESVCEALGRIARYVRHRIVVECDGVPVEGRFLAKPGGTGCPSSSEDDRGLNIVGMQGDSAMKLQEMTTKVAFEIGEPGGDYHGHYSAIVPNRPTEASTSTDYTVWSLGDERVVLDSLLVTSEEALFVKGIQTGPVAAPGHGRERGFSTARYNSWIRPKILLNVRRPSYLDFNLARSSARLRSNEWIEAVWREIASKLRASAFNWPLRTAADQAILLGSCAVFGAVPDCGLDALVGTNQCPLLVLEPGKGPVWTDLKAFVHGEDIVEAPFELAYANANRDFIEIGSPSGLDGWEGDPVLFPLDGLSSHRYPWLKDVLAFSHRALAQSGWHPVAIRTVRPPEKETVPLVCRVWRKSTGSHHKGPRTEGESAEGHAILGTENSLQRLYREAPEVVEFPRSLSQYAAFGSRYWNIAHPKISGMLEALTKLLDWRSVDRLSSDGERVVQYLTSNKFYGFLVPSRFAGVGLALDAPNRLLDVATKEGIPSTEHLVPHDFVPGTIDGYQNPYHYDLRSWKKRGTELGQRLD